MPKTRRIEKKGKGTKSVAVHVSYKIGSRKSARSAHKMKNDELLKEYFSPQRKRDRAKVLAVLRLRNVAIPTEAPVNG